MRLNAFVARSTGVSRRKADELIKQGRISVDGQTAPVGQIVNSISKVALDDKPLVLPAKSTLILLNKPVGYVVSREGQGSKTIYQLLPDSMSKLKPVGRLDKDSSGLLILTDDGNLANKLMHPSEDKNKVYAVTLDRPLTQKDKRAIEKGLLLEDGISSLSIDITDKDCRKLRVVMSEGRNRQIRRTFFSVGYRVVGLKRISMGNFSLGKLNSGEWKSLGGQESVNDRK